VERRSPDRDRRDRDRDYDRRRDDSRRGNYNRRQRSRSRERGGGRSGYRNRHRRDEEEDESKYEWGKRDSRRDDGDDAPKEKEKPNFGLSGKLTEETNTFKGVVIKYAEPPEAKKPKRRWRLYPFKGETALPVLYIHRQSGYLVGRDRKICDIAVDHPSCSKQHAALQFRLVPFEREDGSTGKRVRPYIIDLESANGTFVNNQKIDSKKYIELLEKDVIKFGFSTREYVLLHEASKEDAEDDNYEENEEAEVKQEKVEVKQEPE
jgi:smad nuclear-interacting protein 1